MISHYSRVRQVGEGSFGKVYLVQDKTTGSKLVMKEINTSKISLKEYNEARQEVAVLSTLRHMNIVAYRESFEEKGTLFIVMQYCENGDLFSKIERQNGALFAEEQIWDWFIQLCLAVKYIHERRILHRDIKSQNVFLTRKGTVRLGDFGISRVLDSTHDFARTCIGTPYYLSPEICENKPYGYKSDVWSLGCVLYELATLRHPFLANNIKTLLTKILRGTYPAISPSYSPEMKNLIQDLFQRDPRNRPSAKAIFHRPLIFNRCRGFLTESMFAELEKSLHVVPRRQSKIVNHVKKVLQNNSRTVNNSPYVQSLQRPKTRNRSTGSSRSSISSLDPEKIRKAAVRSREAERKAIARRQKGLALKSQRSTGHTTESSSWMSSSAEDVTPRASEPGRIALQHEDVCSSPQLHRSVSLDSATITPRSISWDADMVEHLPMNPPLDVYSVESAIPFGAPVTGTASFLGQTQGNLHYDLREFMENAKMGSEVVAITAMNQTSTEDVISVHAAQMENCGDHAHDSTRIAFSQQRFQPSVGFPRALKTTARSEASDYVYFGFTVNPSSQKLTCTPAKVKAVGLLEIDTDSQPTFETEVELLENGSPVNGERSRSPPVTARSVNAGLLALAIKDEVTAWVANSTSALMESEAQMDHVAAPDSINCSMRSEFFESESASSFHGQEGAMGCEGQRKNGELAIRLHEESAVALGAETDSESEDTIAADVSPFWTLEARRQDMQRIIGVEPLKVSYWMIADFLSVPEGDDTSDGASEEDVLLRVSEKLAKGHESYVSKIFALVLCDATHFSET